MAPKVLPESPSARIMPGWSLPKPERGDVLLKKGFTWSLGAFSAAIIGLAFGLVRYCELADNAQEQVERYYKYFVDVQIMVFVGFGFLMTFLRRYSYSAVALNYMASAFMMLEALLMLGATQQVFWNTKSKKIELDLALMIDCSFCAASGMIAFGAVIGKATPTQILWLLFWQVPLYALNQHLVIHVLEALDMGGTIVIHLFGAYYGLAASLVLSRKQPMHGLANPKNAGAYLNDVFSMIGTIFLFIYWPSFNGALASLSFDSVGAATDAEKSAQFLCIVNTTLGLLGAVLAVFAMSAVVGGRINMVHVQNSTLAGGVAMGAACTLEMTPGGAILVGFGAGCISTLGFQYLTPFLDRTIGLGDTCGVHNLHGIPAVVGTLVAGLAALGQDEEYLLQETGGKQLAAQVFAGLVTLGIAIGGGLVGGWVVSTVNLFNQDPLDPAELFDDGPWWHGQRVEPLPLAASFHVTGVASNRFDSKAVGATVNRIINASGHLPQIPEGPEAPGVPPAQLAQAAEVQAAFIKSKQLPIAEAGPGLRVVAEDVDVDANAVTPMGRVMGASNRGAVAEGVVRAHTSGCVSSPRGTAGLVGVGEEELGAWRQVGGGGGGGAKGQQGGEVASPRTPRSQAFM